MARDGLFPRSLCRVHERFQTPANAIVAQAAWAILLTVAGTALILIPPPGEASGLPGPILAAWTKLNEKPLYDVLYSYVIFGANLFYMLDILSVFVLRRRRPDLPRPYRTWGYPITPLLYVVAALFLLGNMLWQRQTRIESLSGLAIVLLGLPAYWYFSRRSARTGQS
jgi:APA family basic amino acid/polyamine antiporter